MIVTTIDGIVVCSNAFSASAEQYIDRRKFPLIICDPPYGDIVKGEAWTDTDNYYKWFELCAKHATESATICLWGGTGKKYNRPFIKFAAGFENAFGEWELKNWITWGKKRGYGVADNYLYTREECLIITRGKPTFNIPLLDKLRGYEGYNPEYPAKSEYLRRTNVWTDINELFRGKIHRCQKPDPLYEVLVKTHSNEGDTVFDPGAGSGTTARACKNTGRKFFIIEEQAQYLEKAGLL